METKVRPNETNEETKERDAYGAYIGNYRTEEAGWPPDYKGLQRLLGILPRGGNISFLPDATDSESRRTYRGKRPIWRRQPGEYDGDSG